MKKPPVSCSSNWGRRLSVLLVVTLALPFMAVAPVQAPTAGRVQPVLFQRAAAQPEAMLGVIVQKTVKDSSVEELVTRLGGVVTQDLSLINAFAAELPGKAVPELAQAGGVRWVSLDAPTVSSSIDGSTATRSTSDNIYITWATQLGTVARTTFSRSSAIVDSALGANGTCGSGARVTGSFAGFEPEITPGDVIRKVDLVLHGYTVQKFSRSIKFSVYIRGTLVRQVTASSSIFDGVVGPTKAGPVYVNLFNELQDGSITITDSYQWADLADHLQVVIDQSGFSSGNLVCYDAIGLRVTSAPGADRDSAPAPDTLTMPDTTVDPSQQVNVYNSVIGATQLWNATKKLQGKGLTVAVMDSGVYSTGDLAGSSYVKRVINVNFNKGYHDATDRYGHGTFVASIVAGDGTKSGGKHIGVAPKARILNIRVSDDQGMSTESDVIAGLQWIYKNKDKYNIRVLNLSLNSSVAQSYHTSPLDAACEILWFNGIVVAVSAGNNGTATLFPPANDPFVITVGATDDRGTAALSDDVVASFSAYGTTEAGFPKPDLVAPGKNIIAFMPGNKGLTISKLHPANKVDDNYFRMSGTSMSAPMVSGAVALLLQDEPGLTPDQVKYRLKATANKSWPGYNATMAGTGYLDIYAAVMGATTQAANTGITASHLLWTGAEPVTWGSVDWNSVDWNSVDWNSVDWNSVDWNSVDWNSDYWGQ